MTPLVETIYDGEQLFFVLTQRRGASAPGITDRVYSWIKRTRITTNLSFLLLISKWEGLMRIFRHVSHSSCFLHFSLADANLLSNVTFTSGHDPEHCRFTPVTGCIPQSCLSNIRKSGFLQHRLNRTYKRSCEPFLPESSIDSICRVLKDRGALADTIGMDCNVLSL